MLTFVDHVTVAVRDLDETVRRFRDRLSFLVSGSRREAGSGVENRVIPLLQGYLELISLVPKAERAGKPEKSPLERDLKAFLEAREGLYSFAIHSSDIKADVKALQERGSRLSDPVHEVAGDGDGQSGWWTSTLGVEAGPYPLLIQYDQPLDERVRQAGLSQPFAIRTIDEVTMVVPSLDEAVETYEREYGLTATRRLGAKAQIGLTASKINLVPARTAPLGAPLGLYSVGLGTTDIKGAQSALRTLQIPVNQNSLSWSVATEIDPAHFGHARIDFVQI